MYGGARVEREEAGSAVVVDDLDGEVGVGQRLPE